MPKSRGDAPEVVALLPSLSWSWSWPAWSCEFCEFILSHPVFEDVDLVPAGHTQWPSLEHIAPSTHGLDLEQRPPTSTPSASLSSSSFSKSKGRSSHSAWASFCSRPLLVRPGPPGTHLLSPSWMIVPGGQRHQRPPHSASYSDWQGLVSSPRRGSRLHLVLVSSRKAEVGAQSSPANNSQASITARHGTARHGTARHGTARHGTTRHTGALTYGTLQVAC